MTPPQPRLLLASPGRSDDLRALLADSDYAVTEIAFSPPPADAPRDCAAIVVDVPGAPLAAASLTRWLRSELGDSLVPLVWILRKPAPAHTIAGLDAGADLCLSWPVEASELAAALRAAARAPKVVARLATRANDARLINAHLQSEFRTTAEALALARRTQEVLRPARLPAVGRSHFALAAAGTLTRADVVRLDDDHVGFWLADVRGAPALLVELIALFVRLAVTGREDHNAGWRLLPPADVLDRVNRGLIRLDLHPTPLVGLTYGRMNGRTGALTVARAGLPPPAFLPAEGDPSLWGHGGPFLGAFDATFLPHEGFLEPGGRLVFPTAGTPDAVLAATARHRSRSLPELANAVAHDLSGEGGATVLVVELTAE